MNWEKNRRRGRRVGAMGMELAGAISIASQMALLCPPGFDDVVRRELLGKARSDDGASGIGRGRRR